MADEASRILDICNACRYCEGHCAVFPAAQLIPILSIETSQQANLDYLAHLCHGCGACYRHCQYADPHEFSVNVPGTLASLRVDSHEQLLRPRMLKMSVTHPLTFSLLTTWLFFAGFCLAMANKGLLLAQPGGFYALMPHGVMATLFSGAAALVIFSWIVSARAFWCSTGLPALTQIETGILGRALKDALTLKNLGGGHDLGCYETNEQPSLLKRRAHQLTVSGFMLCFAATSLATVYHYAFNSPAPYDWYDAPKLLGITGGIALALGTLGLLFINGRTDSALTGNQRGFGTALTILLLLTSLSGLLLMLVHNTQWLGVTLAFHLACVLALFVNFACGKFTHGLYRTIALIAYHYRQAMLTEPVTESIKSPTSRGTTV